MKNKKIQNIILPLITVACILVLWSVGSIVAGSEYVLPSFPQTLKEMIKLFSDGNFYLALISTLLRSAIAFLLSFTLAFIFAYFSNRNEIFEKLISPVISIMRALPTVAVVLLLLFWTNSDVAPVIVTMLVVLPTIYTNIYNSLSEIDGDALTMCKVFKVERRVVFKSLILPQIMPPMLLAIGGGLSLNLKLMVAAEVLSSTAKSLGGALSYYNFNLLTSKMVAVVAITVIVGLIIENVFKALSVRVGKWK